MVKSLGPSQTQGGKSEGGIEKTEHLMRRLHRYLFVYRRGSYGEGTKRGEGGAWKKRGKTQGKTASIVGSKRGKLCWETEENRDVGVVWDGEEGNDRKKKRCNRDADLYLNAPAHVSTPTIAKGVTRRLNRGKREERKTKGGGPSLALKVRGKKKKFVSFGKRVCGIELLHLGGDEATGRRERERKGDVIGLLR